VPHHTLLALPCTLLALLTLAACGNPTSDTPANATSSPQDRARAALTQLFSDVRSGDNAAAAGHLVYRGRDKARKWKSLCDYKQPTDKMQVDAICKRLRQWLGTGDVEFVSFRSDTESEGTWLVWRVKAPGATAMYACLDIDGTIALGDVDKD